jgi:hypothetical protein
VRTATDLGHADIADAARVEFEWEKQTTALIRSWSQDKNKIEGVREQAAAIDQKLDRAVSALSTQLQSLVSAFQGEDLGDLAERAHGRLFPAGVAGIVLLNYEEQLAKCRDLVRAFRALPSAELQQLNVEPFVARVEALLPQFKQALDGASKREVSYADIKAREASGQERMLGVVVRCLARYPEHTQEHQKLRAQLLAPILDQQRRLKESFARRAGQTDINPENGEEIAPDA